MIRRRSKRLQGLKKQRRRGTNLSKKSKLGFNKRLNRRGLKMRKRSEFKLRARKLQLPRLRGLRTNKKLN